MCGYYSCINFESLGCYSGTKEEIEELILNDGDVGDWQVFYSESPIMAVPARYVVKIETPKGGSK